MAEGREGSARAAACSLCQRRFQLLETKLQQKCKNTTEELGAIFFEWESGGINDGLCKVCERDQLNNLLQRLEHIGISIDKEHKGIRSEIHEGFGKIEQLAKNRKDELLEELEFIVQEYLVAIGKVQKILEEKISALDSAMQNEVETKHEFLSAYCNKQQGIENLKSLDQAKHMVEMLESRISLRFQFQPAPLIMSLENLGKVETGTEKSLASQTENGVIEKIVQQPCHLGEGQNLASYKNEASEIKMDSVMDCNVNERAVVVSQLVNGDSVIGCNVNELSMVSSQLGNGSIFEEKSLLSNQSKLCLTRGTDIDGKFEDYTPSFQGLVSVSHVVNPCHFYVQKSSEKKMAALLAAEADSLYSSLDMKICPTAVLELGN
ncbi:RING finger protein 17-like [Hemitrygon akajei]|uniref:RING finger protein 17-like n=1 Tax=Hemitrygon akajei TaxID=2704970 RepID=UPI003BF9FAF7